MPKKPDHNPKPGHSRPVPVSRLPKPQKDRQPRNSAHKLSGQGKGCRPPLFPGRTGGR